MQQNNSSRETSRRAPVLNGRDRAIALPKSKGVFLVWKNSRSYSFVGFA